VALVGQDDMRQALLLALVDPRLGGVLLRGEKGTAKSTAARSLVDLIAGGEERVPFVDLPLGATEDRVLGCLDLEAALHEGRAVFEPGLLQRVHQGILYIDEVNLLDDHLVECLLDCCESGINLVEREGLSHSHEARFTLIGSMNPEEGELRPQLLDRFALAVAVSGEQDVQLRRELMRSCEAYVADPAAFRAEYAAETERLALRIAQARERLPAVMVPGHMQAFAVEIAAANHVQGHRADLAMVRAARARAAWDGRLQVEADDLTTVAPLALLHRMRQHSEPELPPPPPPPPPPSDQEDERQDERDEEQQHNEQQREQQEQQQSEPQDHERSGETPPPPPAPAEETVHAVGSPFRVRALASRMDRQLRTGSGRRSRSRSATRQGRYVRASTRRDRDDLAFDATLRAAAPHQRNRRQRYAATNGRLAIHIESNDIRTRVRERRVGNLLLFCVDASGSMGARNRMVETKAAIMSLLLDAYQKRDRVGLISFRGQGAELLLPPTPSIEQAARLLRSLPVGGRTPLAAGLAELDRQLRLAARRDPDIRPLVLLLSDGRANVAWKPGADAPHREAQSLIARLAAAHPQAQFIVVDTEAPGRVRLGLARQLASAAGADYLDCNQLRAEDLVRIVKEVQ